MATQPFARIVPAVATPFFADGKIDLGRMAAHCRWLLAEGADGLLLFGSTGESASLTNAERMMVVDSLIAQGIEPGRLLVGTGCCALADTVLLSSHATDSGCAGVLVVPPFFFKGVPDAGVRRYFRDLIEGVNDPRLAIYLYHFPQTSGVPITPTLAQDLVRAHGSTIRGYKDSSGDWTNTQAVLEALPGLEIFAGTEARMVDLITRGGAGCISATANLHARSIRALLDAIGTPAEGDRLDKVAEFRNAFTGVPLVPAVKAVLAHLHNDPEWSRLRAPLMSLDGDAEAGLLRKLGL
ncbi:dihydrodipicolinate synthase family protein [Niveispirillum cyanobacteriorum]|uniref:Dihydrodipicolinate synthase family protein n=1 Tax=Niveispirillum cyanobacteriorum TaxID=1612173 RepID=A0A2K9NL04_9PROT|nr:dihydrodipicolinate synthase family protein [Niveispirillum cyanobacteriorum]AUN33316.1 dihydrodipicolinate synthase family protein [Niveispirillum cyanobacteriorum]GGE49760.1 dihydrodipicolinate synthase family protein [Niveispirillum cyanobacteriorum]